MKILQINNFHYLRGGAERAYFNTAKVLAEYGHEVAFFSMKHSKNITSRWSKYFINHIDYQDEKNSLFKKIKTVLKIFYNWQARNNLEKLLKEFKPDVAHLHNIYHQLSPSIIDTLKKHYIPIVITLHDYKLICPNYKLFSKNKVCYKCKGGKYYNCFLRRCVKNSFAKSLLMMIEMYLHHKILKIYNKVDLFIAPSEFMKNICIEFGIPAEKIKVVYNFVALVALEAASEANTESYLLYFGRLSEEKGINVLLKAMKKVNSDIKLKIVGDGPEHENYKLQITNYKLNNQVELIGPKYGEELDNLIINAKAVIIPSIWQENMPLSMLESMALGKVVIASKIGGIPEVIKNGENGILFNSNDSDSLVEKINQLREININNMGINAITTMKNFSSRKYYKDIINIYNMAIR